MWNTENQIRDRKLALAAGGYAEPEKEPRGGKLSTAGAMATGVLVTLEIMVAGAMLLNLDFHGMDMIAVFLVFLVIYFGVVAALTDR